MEITVSCVKTDSMKEFSSLDSWEFGKIFIVRIFHGCLDKSFFNDLYKCDYRIIGPPTILNCAQKGEILPYSCCLLCYTHMMNLVLFFTGFWKKEEIVGNISSSMVDLYKQILIQKLKIFRTKICQICWQIACKEQDSELQ